MKTLGIDIGSSFIKAVIYDAAKSSCITRAQVPDTELPISSPHPGWAEQAPGTWWNLTKLAIQQAITQSNSDPSDIGAIGITYQMHGLVCLNKAGDPVRPAIIWCDSRAVETGNRLAGNLGSEYCRNHLLNSPGNFTASKLRWVMDHEPDLYSKINRIMLPGDFIGYRLTGELCTTVGGLSEGIFWDFTNNRVSDELLQASAISPDLLPPVVPTFGEQGRLLPSVAHDLGLKPGIPVSYRSGDQPNNAFSLNVLNPGEIASTAGTSGVVYGVTDRMTADPLYRINTFAHVNHTPEKPRLGVLLCINGTGILNAWLRKNTAGGADYASMNEEAMQVSPGSEGLMILPFGNGAERMLQNHDPGCSILGLNFNKHDRAHLLRAAQEGIAFSFRYGIDVMKETGITPEVIRAGHANMFLSPLFRQLLADISGVAIDLYDTEGSVGAAMGAAAGAGFYSSFSEVFTGTKKRLVTEPSANRSQYEEYYQQWKRKIEMKNK